MSDNFLKFKPIQKFIEGVGKDVKKFFGKDKGCIVAVGDDGIFYGLGLYQWLVKERQNISFANMDDNGKGLDEEKVAGRKVWRTTCYRMQKARQVCVCSA